MVSSQLRALTFFSRIGLVAALLMVSLGVRAQSAAAVPEPQVTEGYINAPIAEVWRIFTTSEGFKATGVDQAEVDLRIGGLIRTHRGPTGTLGDAETTVDEILAYEPERLLALRIRQAPASFPYRDAVDGTWTVIHFTPSGQDMTHVRIVGLGYRDTPQSQGMRRFFAEANRWTLDHIAKPYWPKCKLCAAEPTAQTPNQPLQ